MITVAVYSIHQPSAYLRQTEDGAGLHLGVQFDIRAPAAPDWLLAYDDLPGTIASRVPVQRRILQVIEPPEYKHYDQAFTNQFGFCISPHLPKGYRGRWIESHPGLPWYYGLARHTDGRLDPRLGLAALKQLTVPLKRPASLSIVCSTIAKLPRHRDRLRLVRYLADHLPNQIDVFGLGFRHIPDKSTAIDSYRYHLVIENNEVPHFWTEKLADAYLGYALPLFSGCANVNAYFPKASMVDLGDIRKPEKVLAVVRDVLARDPWPEHAGAIAEARSKLIEDYNMFTLVARIVKREHVFANQPNDQPVLLHETRHSNRGGLGLLRKAHNSLGKRVNGLIGR